MKRVLITGASSGLGRGLAASYARRGATLGLLARGHDALLKVAQEVEAAGGRAHTFPIDVTCLEQTERAIGQFARDAGGLDVVIANAGVAEPQDADRLSPTAVARVLEVNLVGVSNTLLPSIPWMRKGGAGTLVGMASVAAFGAMPGSLSYSASKAAVMTFMEGLALELAGTGIRTVTLCPGFVRTPLTDRNDFSMPFLLEAEDACERMLRAIERGKARYTFPLPMRVAAGILRVSPHWLLHAVSPKSPKKRRGPP